MILYFSGTGNSAHVAATLGDEFGETVSSISALNPSELEFTGRRLVFVFPVYSWGIPPIVRKFISRLSASFLDQLKSRDAGIFMVCTHGDDAGLTAEMMRRDLRRKGLRLAGAWSVVMPNTYVALPGFDVDSQDLQREKLTAAEPRISQIADAIRNGAEVEDVVRGDFAGLKTKLIYPFFMRFLTCMDKWQAGDSCTGCGKCARNCPVGNIEMIGGHPCWNDSCVSCLACYHVCPEHTVNYGNRTKNKGQYYFGKNRY